jgi:hypothetical protein
MAQLFAKSLCETPLGKSTLSSRPLTVPAVRDRSLLLEGM